MAGGAIANASHEKAAPQGRLSCSVHGAPAGRCCARSVIAIAPSRVQAQNYFVESYPDATNKDLRIVSPLSGDSSGRGPSHTQPGAYGRKTTTTEPDHGANVRETRGDSSGALQSGHGGERSCGGGHGPVRDKNYGCRGCTAAAQTKKRLHFAPEPVYGAGHDRERLRRQDAHRHARCRCPPMSAKSFCMNQRQRC